MAKQASPEAIKDEALPAMNEASPPMGSPEPVKNQAAPELIKIE